MTVDPVAVVRSYWDRVFLERDLDALDDLVTESSIRHTADGTRRFTRPELKAHLRDALHAFRAESVVFEAVTADGDDVWMRATVEAVSLATMTPVTMAWLAQYRLDGDRIAEAWALHHTNCGWDL